MGEKKARMNCMYSLTNHISLCHLLMNLSFMKPPHVIVFQLSYKFMSCESGSENVFIMYIFWVLYFHL
jgi:hypothetical protein